MSDNRNFILAIVLSLVILIGWQYFVLGPKMESERKLAETQSGQTTEQTAAGTGAPAAPATPGAATSVPAPQGASGAAAPIAGQPAATAMTREAALATSRRIAIDTPRLSGSINLTGGRVDDLVLKDYRETVKDDSPNITLFSPDGGPNPYYADFGWTADAAAGLALPGRDTVWSVEGNTTLKPGSPVALNWDNGAGLVFKRRFEIDENYLFTVTDSVDNGTGAAATIYPYGLISRIGTPKTSGFYILHEGFVGVFGEDGLSEQSYKDVTEEGEIKPAKVNSGWLGITDKYWAAAMVPGEGTFQPRYSHAGGAQDIYQADFLSDAVTVGAGASASTTTRLFAGAKEVSVIDGYEASAKIDRFELLIDWGWFYFITKPLFFAIDWFFKLFGNFGVAILAVTVIVKLFFFPLANKSYVSMSRMKKVQPEMQAIKERHPDDKMKQQQELMELYKKEKINPLAGCLPIFVQIPVFFSLYKVLFVTIEMRHAPFFGWIQDLSAPDPTTLFNLFGLIPYDPPQFLMLGIWPLIMGITMFVQMKLNPTPPDPTQQMIFNWMPVLFTFMLASFPAGLVIYWAWNNFLSIVQQWVIMRRQGVEVDILGNIRDTFRKKPKAGS
ncbi:MAG: membrane protein insertase YidC [Hyphomicrobiales bacterium]|nr:MAG: membrane protein insertase YidC [Hyphomicrobiales bacterium]